MEIKETPMRHIKLEGYKLPQFKIHFENRFGEFWLFPVFPTKEFVLKFYSKNKEKLSIGKEAKKYIKEILNKTPSHLSIPKFSALFAQNRFLVKEGGDDSFFEFTRWQLAKLEKIVISMKRKLNTVDKLQGIFENSNKSFPVIYSNTMRIIEGNKIKGQYQTTFFEFLDTAMNEFENLLSRNVGGNFGIYEINFFKFLYRKQPMFSDRILACDLDKILSKNDIELDKIITSLLVLGWAFELDDRYYKKSSLEIQKLADKFLRVYLSALAGKIIYQRIDEAEKKRNQRTPVKELTFSQFEYENDNGERVVAEELENKLVSNASTPLEKIDVREQKEELYSQFSKNEAEIIKLLTEGYKQNEIANRLKISNAAVCKTVKKIRKQLK